MCGKQRCDIWRPCEGLADTVVPYNHMLDSTTLNYVFVSAGLATWAVQAGVDLLLPTDRLAVTVSLHAENGRVEQNKHAHETYCAAQMGRLAGFETWGLR